jgi:hypothetical protein
MPFITLTLIGSKRPHRFRTYDIESFGTTTANESFVCMASGSIVPVDETTERIDRLIAEAEADDDCAGCQFDPDAVFELTPLGEECLGAAGKLYPVAQSPAKLLELVDEAQSDAKVADERTRWFKKLAEKRLAAIEKFTAAEKELRLELSAAKFDKDSIAGWYQVALDKIARKDEANRKLEAQIAEYQRTAKIRAVAIGKLHAELDEWRRQYGPRPPGANAPYVKPSDPAVNPKWSSTYNDFNRE